jgi:hypothetical protein
MGQRMNTPISVEQLHRALGGEISRGKNGPQVLCPGPGHSHSDRSLAVSPAYNEDGFIVHSFAGDDPLVAKDYVRDKLGLDPFRPRQRKAHVQNCTPEAVTGRTIAKTYDYTDESGTLLFQAVRLEPKDFRQRRPNGNGGWIWNLDGVQRVPYRLPELIEAVANNNPVFIVAEAERQARQQAAVARAERNQKLQAEMREQSSRQMQSRQLADLHQASIRNETFRNAAVRSQAHANARQRLKSVLFPPEPPQPVPEPTIVLDDDDAARWHRTWFK